ncbi:hypothetical protein AMTRI_Chr04g184500 [Amborella trichopoda]|uniref:uncharacterized protein LOC110006374 n=1 Tax=Amborella trichopoda TaxID=13333 RepID=UPI0009BE2C7B|nr:uncharacterized protein LOC110006374 [Amborella trichopoda]|eukprot:XP_020517254.1 uncharacterized protein LOC110006374 [Amborella trichopoda]
MSLLAYQGAAEKQENRRRIRIRALKSDAVFKTHPMNVLNERTLKETFFGNYKTHYDLPSVVDKYMKKVYITWRSSSHIRSHSQRSIRLLNTCSKETTFAASFE